MCIIFFKMQQNVKAVLVSFLVFPLQYTLGIVSVLKVLTEYARYTHIHTHPHTHTHMDAHTHMYLKKKRHKRKRPH